MNGINYLDQIIFKKKQAMDQLQNEIRDDLKHPLNQILNRSYTPDRCFSRALKQSELAVIAEIKRKSPTIGNIRAIEDPVELAQNYVQGGAAAISVLTDSDYFGGSLTDLSRVSHSLRIDHPRVAILRKDFIIHSLQLTEAVLAGAHAVLLIVHAVGNNLKFLIQEASRLGLEVLTEVHNRAELELALDAEASIIGINHRNLETFEIDLNISETLKPLIPSHVITVAESGIHKPDQARKMRELGFDAVLIGEALVRSNDPGLQIRLMKEKSHES